MDRLLNRFLEYVKIDTTSDDSSGKNPSTNGQRVLAEKLKDELLAMGVDEVEVDENSYLMARLKSNMDKKVQTVGFISHLDTAPDAKGKDVKPKIHENYQGGRIDINEGLYLDEENSSDLKLYKGHSIITSDGTTLLGADDKGGISAIMSAVEFLIDNPQIERGDVVIGFTPDEEIGQGGDNFDVEKFGADFAYTVDGETMGEFNYETFNACEIKVKVKGYNVHPGSAKGKMINASDVACLFASRMPLKERPEYTEGYEGFFHLCDMKGSVEEAELIYIARDFFKDKMKMRKEFVIKLAKEINDEFAQDIVSVEIEDEYFNMREILEDKQFIIDYAKNAYEKCGLEFDVKPIRGGTDGSKLSFKGLPCPNIFVGCNNLHSVREFASLEAMNKAKEVIVQIVKEVAKS